MRTRKISGRGTEVSSEEVIDWEMEPRNICQLSLQRKRSGDLGRRMEAGVGG